MKHFGDITKLSGYDLPPVDIITGGSPCQDLSVAGLRKGLSAERSGLFMEQIRIVKEMRQRDRESDGYFRLHPRPRYMVWENVTGALSSSGKGLPKGSDFQCVLTEIVRIVKADAPDVPLPDKGKWPKSGCLMGFGDDGERFSVAWRLHDGQFWGRSIVDNTGKVVKAGTPQRRRRIALVADFGGCTAPDILFEKVRAQSESMSGHPEQGEEKGEGTSGDSEDSSGESGERTFSFQERAGKPGGGKGILIQHDHVGALSTLNNQSVLHKCLNPWDVQSKHIQPENGVSESLYSGECRWSGGETYVLKKNE